LSVAISALAILPPALGRPISLASIARPARAAQADLSSSAEFASACTGSEDSAIVAKPANVRIPMRRMVVSVPMDLALVWRSARAM
jgi:hypothetical protein